VVNEGAQEVHLDEALEKDAKRDKVLGAVDCKRKVDTPVFQQMAPVASSTKGSSS
jgi:hypothetical protein